MGDGTAGIEAEATVGKRIRGDVDDPHDECPMTEFEDSAIGQGNREDRAGDWSYS
jgi:hypothetical protein